MTHTVFTLYVMLNDAMVVLCFECQKHCLEDFKVEPVVGAYVNQSMSCFFHYYSFFVLRVSSSQGDFKHGRVQIPEVI